MDKRIGRLAGDQGGVGAVLNGSTERQSSVQVRLQHTECIVHHCNGPLVMKGGAEHLVKVA
jgi:hypothetical protein